jgi:hypothetical protein
VVTVIEPKILSTCSRPVGPGNADRVLVASERVHETPPRQAAPGQVLRYHDQIFGGQGELRAQLTAPLDGATMAGCALNHAAEAVVEVAISPSTE